MCAKADTNTNARRIPDETALSLYLREIKKIPLLSKEDEKQCARKAAEGDQEAKEKLIQSNLRFVVKVAKKYHNPRLSLVDLISEGNIGLMTAVERFDVSKGYRFITYAVWWIRRAILQAIFEKSRIIRVPHNRIKQLVLIERTREELKREGNPPGLDAVAEKLGMEKAQLVDIINTTREYVSLESQLHSDDGSSILDHVVEDKGTRHPDDLAMDESLHESINLVLKQLSTREADIIERSFGLNGKRPMSLTELSTRYRISRERVRQIKKKALKKLQRISGDFLRPYLA